MDRSPLDSGGTDGSGDSALFDGGDTDRTPPVERSGGSSGPPSPDDPTPGWLIDDGLSGTGFERQVLVAGETVGGLFLAALLRAAGYDPVVAGGGEVAPGSGVCPLWPTALAGLDALGVGAMVRESGTAVDGVSVDRPASDSPVYLPAPADGPSPVVVDADDLRSTLADRVGDAPRRPDQRVASASRRDRGVAVEFDDGVREWFDLVVDAGRSPVAAGTDTGRSSGDTATLTQSTRPVAVDDDRGRIHEVWHPEALVQLVPRPRDRGRLLRTTVPAGGPDAAEFTDALPCDTSPTGAAAVRSVRQGTSVGPARWGRGRVARCGAGAFPVVPGTAPQVSLAVEDAWSLVDELARCRAPVPDLVDAYAARRHRRLSRLVGPADGGAASHPLVPEGSEPPLATLSCLCVATLTRVTGASSDSGP